MSNSSCGDLSLSRSVTSKLSLGSYVWPNSITNKALAASLFAAGLTGVTGVGAAAAQADGPSYDAFGNEYDSADEAAEADTDAEERAEQANETFNSSVFGPEDRDEPTVQPSPVKSAPIIVEAPVPEQQEADNTATVSDDFKVDVALADGYWGLAEVFADLFGSDEDDLQRPAEAQTNPSYDMFGDLQESAEAAVQADYDLERQSLKANQKQTDDLALEASLTPITFNDEGNNAEITVWLDPTGEVRRTKLTEDDRTYTNEISNTIATETLIENSDGPIVYYPNKHHGQPKTEITFPPEGGRIEQHLNTATHYLSDGTTREITNYSSGVREYTAFDLDGTPTDQGIITTKPDNNTVDDELIYNPYQLTPTTNDTNNQDDTEGEGSSLDPVDPDFVEIEGSFRPADTDAIGAQAFDSSDLTASDYESFDTTDALPEDKTTDAADNDQPINNGADQPTETETATPKAEQTPGCHDSDGDGSGWVDATQSSCRMN